MSHVTTKLGLYIVLLTVLVLWTGVRSADPPAASKPAAPLREGNESVVKGKIVFVDGDGRLGFAIYSSRLNGAEKRRLTHVSFAGSSKGVTEVYKEKIPAILPTADCPKWSPDGKKIAFIAGGPFRPDPKVRHWWRGPKGEVIRDGPPDGPAGYGEVRDIWLMNSDGSDLRPVVQIGESGDVRECRWSPDGKRIAFVTNAQLSVVDVDTKRIVVLWKPKAEEDVRGELRVGGFCWSWDGNRIVFTLGGSIGVVNQDGTGFRLLTRSGDDARTPYCWPDGRITFTRCGGILDAWVMDQDGTHQEHLTRGYNIIKNPYEGKSVEPLHFVHDFVLSPDRKRIAFETLSSKATELDQAGKFVVAVKDVDGDSIVEVCDSPGRRYDLLWEK